MYCIPANPEAIGTGKPENEGKWRVYWIPVNLKAIGAGKPESEGQGPICLSGMFLQISCAHMAKGLRRSHMCLPRKVPLLAS